MVEAGLGLLYIASMFPSDFAQIIEEPNMMWRRIETSIASRSSWNCPNAFGSSKRRKPGQLITLPFEAEEIMRIQSALRYGPLVSNQVRTEKMTPKETTEHTTLDLQIHVPAQLGGSCQFCEKEKGYYVAIPKLGCRYVQYGRQAQCLDLKSHGKDFED